MPTKPPAHLRTHLALLALGLASSAVAAPAAESIDDLLALSLEDLGRIEVTSASLQPVALAKTAASLYVIRGEDVRALGIRSLPEALRLAPNLQVARVGSRGYAISARGFKTTLSNKMLVLIDGRPIYTPLFAGVLWDVQDVAMGDLDRIEVISGPGASLWGTNAVNGVINIVTRDARDTLGAAVAGAAGSDEHVLSARVGGGSDAGAWRVYGKRFEIDRVQASEPGVVGDGWEQTQGGFRADFGSPGDANWRVHGDVYSAKSAPTIAGPIDIDGYNVLTEWISPSSLGGEWRIQGWIDVVDREDPLIFLDRLEQADVSLQHADQVGRHHVVWGLGYRTADDQSTPGLFVVQVPADKHLSWAHVFLQDEFAISDTLTASAGLRLERNTYTGWEVLPNVRVAWQVQDDLLLWGAASRAVRSPARFDRELRIPVQPPFIVLGGPQFESEISNVAEIGTRWHPSDRWSLTATAFHHWHEDLRSGQPAPEGGSFVVNGIKGTSYGVEAWSTYRVTGEWDLSVGLLELRKHLSVKDGFFDPSGTREQGNDAKHQYVLRATRRLGEDHQIAVSGRYVSELPDPAIPSYTTADIHWSWHPSKRVELGLSVENVFDRVHQQFQPAAGRPPWLVERQVLASLRLSL